MLQLSTSAQDSRIRVAPCACADGPGPANGVAGCGETGLNTLAMCWAKGKGIFAIMAEAALREFDFEPCCAAPS